MIVFASEMTEYGPTVLWQVAAATALGTIGAYTLLPRPRKRLLPIGIFLSLAALVSIGLFLWKNFGQPTSDTVGSILFWLFSSVAVSFGMVLVAQRNPARGAMAFAFVIISTCGLFLLLAAPFLMAATIIIYAGAIIVTFLFVLMLSNAQGPSDENDRSREPLLGSLAGFGFAGLLLMTLYMTSPAGNAVGYAESLLPAATLTAKERDLLLQVAQDLQQAEAATDRKLLDQQARDAFAKLSSVIGYEAGETRPPMTNPPTTLQDRLRIAGTDARVDAVRQQAFQLNARKKQTSDRLDNAVLTASDLATVRADLRILRDDVLLLRGQSDLPARNVAAIGYALYSEHLISVEMAGTLLLVATIGAVAIAGTRGKIS